ncbi:MAG: hypothetical protein ACLFTQ_00895 [Candidatus Aenigmatarchaeota archaeon]
MKICPSCGSEEIRTDRTNFLALLGLDRGYSCPDCGYEGRLFLEIDEEMEDEAKEFFEERDTEDFKKELMDREMDFSRGRFLFGVVFLLLGTPLIVLMSLGLNFFIGVISVLIGLALLHSEAKKFRS